MCVCVRFAHSGASKLDLDIRQVQLRLCQSSPSLSDICIPGLMLMRPWIEVVVRDEWGMHGSRWRETSSMFVVIVPWLSLLSLSKG